MNFEIKLREQIRRLIDEEFSRVDEISTTGNVAGYLTPYAFAGDGGKNAARVKRMAKSIGYKLTKRGEEDSKKIDNLQENYYEYRNDETRQPHQKIGQAISEVNKQLHLIEKIIRMNKRLQKETGTTDDKLWKRTRNQMVKLEGRLIELAGKLREMRG